MRLTLTFIIFIFVGCSSQAPKSRIDKTAMPLIDSFFNRVGKKEADVALGQLLSSNPYFSLNDSATIDLKNKFVLINEASGPYVGNKMLKERYLEEDISIYSYLAKYEKKFYRFIFMFYNNGSDVRLYKFLFDDDIDIELEGSLKFYSN